MLRAYLILFLFFLVKLLPGQNRVSFRLDLDPLVQEKLFLPEEGHRVFVRGSMNQWQGTDLELLRAAGGNLYSATFQMEGRAGDTIAYKYVIEKGQEKVFWEAEPDPGIPKGFSCPKIF